MKNLSSLIYTTYFQSYLKAADLIHTLTDAPTLSPDLLQDMGYHTVLANEMRPLLAVSTHVEYFSNLFEEPIYSRKYLVKEMKELQASIRKNQKAITPSLSERIYGAILKAKDQAYPPVNEDVSITLFDLEPDEPYDYSGDMINKCFKNAPKANLEQIPTLLNHIQALDQLDTNLPFKELRTQAKAIVKQINKIL